MLTDSSKICVKQIACLFYNGKEQHQQIKISVKSLYLKITNSCPHKLTWKLYYTDNVDVYNLEFDNDSTFHIEQH